MFLDMPCKGWEYNRFGFLEIFSIVVQDTEMSYSEDNEDNV